MAIGDIMRRYRLTLHGHVERKGDGDCVKGCTKLVVEGMDPVSMVMCITDDDM